jgi:hypothetical protein
VRVDTLSFISHPPFVAGKFTARAFVDRQVYNGRCVAFTHICPYRRNLHDVLSDRMDSANGTRKSTRILTGRIGRGNDGGDHIKAGVRVTVTNLMPSNPVDVLRVILEYVDKANLAKICLLNKICCSCSQDVLYREISPNTPIGVVQTLARSTYLARRVRSFEFYYCEDLHTALQNMSSLRRLHLWHIDDASILDGCTFKLDSFAYSFHYDESLQNFLNSQPNLTEIEFHVDSQYSDSRFEATCLPNLTRAIANPSWIRTFIQGRPVREVKMFLPRPEGFFNLNSFALSTAPIQKLGIPCVYLYPEPIPVLVSIFPSLVHLILDVNHMGYPEGPTTVRRLPFHLFIQ